MLAFLYISKDQVPIDHNHTAWESSSGNHVHNINFKQGRIKAELNPNNHANVKVNAGVKFWTVAANVADVYKMPAKKSVWFMQTLQTIKDWSEWKKWASRIEYVMNISWIRNYWKYGLLCRLTRPGLRGRAAIVSEEWGKVVIKSASLCLAQPNLKVNSNPPSFIIHPDIPWRSP